MTGSGTQGLVVLFTDTDNTVEVDLRRETMDLVWPAGICDAGGDIHRVWGPERNVCRVPERERGVSSVLDTLKSCRWLKSPRMSIRRVACDPGWRTK